MIKKYFLLLILPVIALSCTKKVHTEFKVFPVLKSITIPAGSDGYVAIRAEIPEGAHIYGNPKGPGIGKATEVRSAKSSPFHFNEARFLTPEKFSDPASHTYTWGYDNETTIFLPLNVPGRVKPGIYNTEIIFDSLLCTESSCVPKIVTINYPLSVAAPGTTGTVYNDKIQALFLKARAPKQKGEKSPALKDTANTSSRVAEGLEALSFKPVFLERGVSGILQAILFGIIAGILLNFMPCVLPVVSLKILSFVQHAHKERKKIFMMGLLFAAGILVSFTLLAFLAAFFGYNWGELFQNRLFLIGMMSIVLIFALSLFEVFTINIPAFAGRAAGAKNIYADAFLKGLLATLLATPCSGPFLGGTLAWSLTQPPYVIFLIFISIGVGMALPYVLLTANPKFLKYIPKPGEWMKTFEQSMGFLLLFTVIYLVSILETVYIVPTITFLGFISLAFWQYGRYGSLVNKRITRLLSFTALAGIIIGGYFFAYAYIYSPVKNSSAVHGAPFSITRLISNRDSGRISMVKFTADWCPNCRLVEKSTLESDAVKKAITGNEIDFMTADITRENRAASGLLHKFKSFSIPVLAIIPPGKNFNHPIILRDIYSKEDVLKAIRMAGVFLKHKKKKTEYRIKIKGIGTE